MADITVQANPAQIRWINEELRPLCELVRDLWILIEDTRMSWDDTHAAIIGNVATDLIQDGREAEGVSRLNARDVSRAMTALASISDMIRGVANPTSVIDATRFVDLLTVRSARDRRG